MVMNKKIIVGAIIIIVLASCRATKNIQTAVAKKDTVVQVTAPPVQTGEDSAAIIRENYGLVKNNHIDFKTFSAKVDVDYEDAEGKKYNVNAHVRMYKDSAIWVSVTAILGIEGLRMYITKDSVKLLDKQNKIYSARSVSYLQELSDLPLDLSSLQDLLIGNPVFLDSNITSFTRSTGSISLLSSGDFFKNFITVSESNKLMQSSKLDDQDDQRNRTCYLTYNDYESVNGFSFPTKRSINVTEKKHLDIKMNFKQYEFNETLSFPFSVPKNYKRK
jgi:hypothetical protein